jgi:predicted DsbA family dithiol-disulfide isomerase
MYDRMTEQAALEDLNFNLNKIKITPSTILSHILIDLSKGLKEQKLIVENIFRNYFIDGHDIGNVANLIAIGVKNGLNKKKIEKTFETKKNIEDILNKNQSAHSLGISGVPVIALNDKIVIQGAESTELIISKIKQNN